MQNWVKKVRKGSRDLILKFWDPLHISETVRGTNGTNDKNAKLGQKGFRKGSRNLLQKFEDPLHISGTFRARNV